MRAGSSIDVGGGLDQPSGTASAILRMRGAHEDAAHRVAIAFHTWVPVGLARPFLTAPVAASSTPLSRRADPPAPCVGA